MRYAEWTEMEPQSVLVVTSPGRNDVIVVEAQNTGMSANATRSEMTPFSTTVVSVFEIEDGLIEKALIYYDPNELFN